jgi:thiaminase
MSFTRGQLARVEPLWRRMLAHPFLLQTRDGTIPDQTFARWMQQDYLFVAAGLSFLAALLARAPRRHREPLADAIAVLRAELRLFEDQAAKAGVQLDEAAPAFVNHAYMQFLMATALGRSYPEAYTVLYAAEKAYHDSWRVVREGLSPTSRWYPFVDNWAGAAFAAYVADLQDNLDALAEQAGSAEQQVMAELFEVTIGYEIAFWEMALSGEGWPGIPNTVP